ncbi:MAG: hypothetical protein AABX48_01865 [Nanoarchaeota archaeon]
MKALDYMIKKNLFKYHCDPWYSEPHKSNYNSMEGIEDQVNYQNEIFVVTRNPASSGGLRDSPPNMTIIRIKK